MRVYISNYLSETISILDYNSFEFIKNINLGENINPKNFCVFKDYIYIHSESDGFLYLLDLTKNKIVDSIFIGRFIKKFFIYNKEIFIINEDVNSIYIIDAYHLSPIGVIGIDDMPHDLDIYNNILYLTCRNSIIEIDINTKNIIKNSKFNFKPWSIKFDKIKKEIYTCTLDGKIIILDEQLNIKTIKKECMIPIEFEISYIYKKIYIVDLKSNSILILDYDTKDIIKKIECDGYLQGMKLSNDFKYLFISDTKNDLVKMYDCKDDCLINEVNSGKEPTTISIV